MTLAANLKALDVLAEQDPSLSLTETSIDGLAPIGQTGTTFVWNGAFNGNFVGTGWLNHGVLGVPGAGDTADMSVTGAAYTVLCQNVTITSDSGTWVFDDYVVGKVILGVDTTLEIDPNSFDLQYGGTNSGEILVDYVLTVGNSGANVAVLSSKNTGEIYLNDAYTNATLTGYNASSILDLVHQSISGAGTISNLILSIDKNSAIDSGGHGATTFVLNTGNTIYNEGAIAANTGSTLLIENETLDESAFVKGDSAGTIEAITSTSTVNLVNDHIEGGEIYGVGLIQFQDANSIVDGATTAGAVTILGEILAAGGNNVTFKGMITNHGNIDIQGNTQLTVDGSSGATFSSGGVGAKGSLIFDDSANNNVNTNSNATTLTNVDNTISGAVHFSNMTIVNQAGGIFNANATNNQMIIDGSDHLQNAGLVEATGKAGLSMLSQVIDAALGGKIVVGNGSVIDLASDTFQGGLISALGTGKWVLADANNVLDGSTTSGAVTLTTTLVASGGNNLLLKGTIHNEGVLAIQANTQLTIDGTTGATLDSGGLTTKGKLTFDDSANNNVNTNGNATTLTNVDNTISGAVHFSNMTIVNRAGGTLNANATNNQMIIDGSDHLQNSGVVEATGKAGLSIASQIIDAALGGKIVVGNGSQIDLSSDTFQGGVISALGSGKWVLADANNVLDGSTASGAVTLMTTLAASVGNNLLLKGTIHNESTVSIRANTQLTIDGTTGATLDSGGLTTKGKLTFDDSANNNVNTNGNATTLTNVDNTISGAVHVSNMTIVNEAGGTINATGTFNQFVFDASDSIQNSGLIEATGKAGMWIGSAVIDGELGGRIIAGNGSLIDLSSDRFQGGVISSVGTGKWVLLDGGNVLDGSTASGAVTLTTTFAATNGDTLTLKGTIHNEGTLSVQATTQLTIDGATGATLDSGGLKTKGKLTFDDSGNVINTNSAATTLTNVDNTISGAVAIYNTTIVNEAGGTINATGAINQIVFGVSDAIQNEGLLEATGAAGLTISGVTVTNTGGTILAGAGSKVELLSDSITYGTLRTSGSGIIEIADTGVVFGAGATTNGLTLNATIHVDDGAMLAVTGSVVNSGTIDVGVTGAATLELGASLSGGGSIVMFDSASSQILVGFNNIDNTISGAGTISAHIQQQSGGVIEATHLDNAMILATGAAIANGGALEANGGLLQVMDAVTGAGHLVIANGGTASFASTFDENVTFVGAGAGALDLATAYKGTITGFTFDDSVELLGQSADGVYLNASGQLVVTSGANTVATLQLSGNSNNEQFFVQTNAAGVDVIEIATATVSEYLANISSYDKKSGGFAIVDWAANIVAHLTALAADPHIDKIVSSSGVVTVDVLTFKSTSSLLNKVVGGFAISDTGANVTVALGALSADVNRINSISLTSGTVAVNVSVFAAKRILLDKIAGGFTVSDTGANIAANLSALSADAANIGAIITGAPVPGISISQFATYGTILDKIALGFIVSDTVSNIVANLGKLGADSHVVGVSSTNGAVTVSIAVFAKSASALNKIVGGFTISDTAANIFANLATISADAAHVHAIVTGAVVSGLSTSQFATYQTILDKLTLGFNISDTAANIQASLSKLAADSHIAKISVTAGAVTTGVATFSKYASALNKIVGGFAISDTGAIVTGALAALTSDVNHINAISLTSGTVVVSIAQFVADRGLLNKIAGGYAIIDTASKIQNNLALIAANSAHINAITASSGAVNVSAATFLANRATLDKIGGGFVISDTAANITANLAAIAADVANIQSISTGAPVTGVSVSGFATYRSTLDKLARGFSISDTATNIQNALSALFADVGHISSLVATSGHVTVSDATFTSDRALLDKLTPGFVISDVAATIEANFSAIVADVAHISSLTTTDTPLTFAAATFVADRTTMDKVTGGVNIADTTSDIIAEAVPLYSDLAHIKSVYFTDLGTPTLTLTAVQLLAAQPILAKVANSYVLNDVTSTGVITTGHGNSLVINDVPGVDTITGGGTNETFVFGDGLGHATITDFSAHASGTTHDAIQLAATDYGSFNLLTTSEASQHGADVWLQSSTSKDLIVISNLTTQTLGGLSADFKFV